MLIPYVLLDFQAGEEQDDDFQEPDGGIDGVAHERAGNRPAGVALVEAGAGEPIDFSRLTENEREREAEDDGGAGRCI